MKNKDIIRELAKLDVAADTCGNLEKDKQRKLSKIAHFVIQTVIKAKLVDFDLPRDLKVSVQQIEYLTGTDTYCLLYPEHKGYMFSSDHICHLDNPIINTKIDFFVNLIETGWLDELTTFIQNRASKSSKIDEIYETLPIEPVVEEKKSFWERLFK